MRNHEDLLRTLDEAGVSEEDLAVALVQQAATPALLDALVDRSGLDHVDPRRILDLAVIARTGRQRVCQPTLGTPSKAVVSAVKWPTYTRVVSR